MRRKLKLKVLYWPIFASIAIIIVLFLFGPSGDALRLRLQQLSSTNDIGSILSSWLPANTESSRQQGVDPRSLPRPRTLSQRGEFADYKTKQNVDVREGLDASLRPRSIHSPHALRAEIHEPMDLVAEAKLFAPRLDLDEELAGVDRSVQMIGQLASLPLDDGSDPDDYAEGDAGEDSQYDGESFQKMPGERHGLGGGWPETPQLIAELDTLARVASSRVPMHLVSSDSVMQPFEIDKWHQSVVSQLATLRKLPSVSSPDAGAFSTNCVPWRTSVTSKANYWEIVSYKSACCVRLMDWIVDSRFGKPSGEPRKVLCCEFRT